MARTTFSGPIKSGTIQYTTGTTLGKDRANVGFTAVSKMAPTLINYNDTTATATGLIIPAYSQIIGISKYLGIEGHYIDIPLCNDNTDYQEYLEWAKTNTAEEPD